MPTQTLPVQTADHAERLLAELAASPLGVAGLLQSHGITGYRESCSGCPVAEWLRRSGITGPIVDMCTTSLYDDVIDRPVELTNPRAVALFIEEFDNGRYPDLCAGTDFPPTALR